jgi:hypothetical protein
MNEFHEIDVLLLIAGALVFAMLLSGCSLNYSRDQIGFWDQCIKANGYGFTMATAYGPFNLGYLTYERNVNCEKDIQQQKPVLPPVTRSNWEIKEVTIIVTPNSQPQSQPQPQLVSAAE